MQAYRTKIIQKKEVAKEVFEFHLERPEGFVFESGQFVQVVIPHKEKSVVRSYSLSSTTRDTYIELCIKLLDDGVGSNFFRNSKEGDEIIFRGPYGRFVCNDTHRQKIFVATGAGVAPVWSMIRDELEIKKHSHPIHLLFGVRNEEHIFWEERFALYAKKYAQFTYAITLSQPADLWTGLVGRVTDHVSREAQNANFYLCGSPNMVKDVRQIIHQNGIDLKRINFEVF